MKLFRRQTEGINPDAELSRYLCESTGFRNVPPYGGVLEYQKEGEVNSTVAILQAIVENEGDGWQWTLEELERYYERCAALEFPAGAFPALQAGFYSVPEFPVSPIARENIGMSLDAASTIGKRTGELHLALSAPVLDAAFAPEEFSAQDLEELRDALGRNAAHVFGVLKDGLASLPDEIVDIAALVLSRRGAILDRFRSLSASDFHALRTRIHGDYHLGQLLRSKTDVFILDFEGEPARPLEERRRKQSPLKDVAGMLRSFGYAAYVALMKYTSRRPEHFERLEPWARLWEKSVSQEFLHVYCETVKGAGIVPSKPEAFESLLGAYVLDKALYELLYELNNRPTWVQIPLAGILALPTER